jgi:hypothetical protein
MKYDEDFDFARIDRLMKRQNPCEVKPVTSLEQLHQGVIVVTSISENVYHVEKVGRHYTQIGKVAELAKYTADRKVPMGFEANNEGRFILSRGRAPEFIVGLTDDLRKYWCDDVLSSRRILVNKRLADSINLIYMAVRKKHAEAGEQFALVLQRD